MSDTRNMIAFDCSNSSVRTILGTLNGKKIKLKTILRRPNGMIRVNGTDYWDILQVYQNIVDGLREAASQVRIDSIGVCTWGVDFALYTREKSMLGNPLAYRNPFGQEILAQYSEGDRRDFFQETGILCDKINSIYMLKALQKKQPEFFQAADRILMIPDILNYMLTGVMQNEPSELSTSQLMNVRTSRISEWMCRHFDLDKNLFGEIGTHGTKIGSLLPSIAEEVGITYEIPVICVPSHDTAAAVLAIPAEEEDFAFISSGTWALIGSEEKQPVITEQVRQAGITNELGAFGAVTLLRNNMGMFIVQKLKSEFPEDLDWEEFYQLADQYSEVPDIPVFNVNDERFFNPDNMGDAIWADFLEHGYLNGTEEKNTGLILQSFLRSMALSYQKNIHEIEKIRGKNFNKIYIVGGGVKNHRLNKLTADITGKPVVTGSSESTSLGNLLAQIRYFFPSQTVSDLRSLVRSSIETKIFYPQGGTANE